MSPSASLKCLSRQELQVGSKLTLSFYKLVKEAVVRLPETSFEEVLISRTSDLIKHSELKKVCGDSDAALISEDGLTLFVSFKKAFPAIQFLKVPAIVKKILIARVVTDNETAGDHSELEFTSLKLRTEEIELNEELIAFDSVVRGDLEDGIYALKIVSDKLDSVITEEEIRKYLSRQDRQPETRPRKSAKRRRRKKSRKRRKSKRSKKAARKSR